MKDCIQEVFIHLINNRKSLLITPGIHVYLFKSLRNKLFEEYRSSNRKKDILKLMPEHEGMQVDHAEQLIIEHEERQRIRNELLWAMNKLTGHQKEVIFLKYSEGLDHDKIAELLKIDKASVYTLLCRSLKTLKKAFLKNNPIATHNNKQILKAKTIV